MITKEQALENVKNYIKEKNRNYSYINEEKIWFKENEYINYGKYEEKNRNVYVINYDIEGYTEDIPYFVYVDAETGEILFTITQHGYAEDWED
ncbi:PepSY domain-containing protein [Sphingobacterium spiritivorum]|uniref:PepSY domain-containing protein n=1 Tax=Sphingobacterium spiritivorum TaxID=258 RepID=UPI003DA2E4A9